MNDVAKRLGDNQFGWIKTNNNRPYGFVRAFSLDLFLHCSVDLFVHCFMDLFVYSAPSASLLMAVSLAHYNIDEHLLIPRK